LDEKIKDLESSKNEKIKEISSEIIAEILPDF
jgi:hypothetical protein